MHIRSRILLALAGTAAIVAMASSVASATRLATNESHFVIAWTPLEFQASGASPATVRCNVTLGGSFHSRTISKVAGQLIGAITEAIVNTCSGGTARALTEKLPWHVQYGSFSGTLPNITGVTLKLIGAAFSIIPTGSMQCLAVTSTTEPALGIGNRETRTGAITGLRAEEATEIELKGGFFESCRLDKGHFRGTGTVENSLRNNLVITLVA
jgi:hypothetical protein